MIRDILTALTSLAVATYRETTDTQNVQPAWPANPLVSDPVIQEVLRLIVLLPNQFQGHEEITDLIFAEPEFADLAPREGQLDPMLLYPDGGFTVPPRALIGSLFSSAFTLMYLRGSPTNEDTFVDTVLKGFEQLRRAIRGENVRAYRFTGIARFSLPEETQIQTPWGIIRPAPPVSSVWRIPAMYEAITDCVFAEERFVPVRFQRVSSPEPHFNAADLAPSRSTYLFPLACALASKDIACPIAPLMTWSTLILPLQNVFINSMPQSIIIYTHNTQTNVGNEIAELEEWTRVVEQAHTSSVDIAARRLVSAIAHRTDRSDALIDAVMTWENLLGTETEVSYRVCASLAKLLEKDVTERDTLYKNLSEIYKVRNGLVHGGTIHASKVNKACSDAIEVAVRALRLSYLRGYEWLSLKSRERSHALLLE